MEILINRYERRRVIEIGGVKNTDNADDAEDLKRKVDALAIAVEAMSEILQERLGVSDSAILEKMQEIDGRDGRLDGKTSPVVLLCPECGRKSNSSHSACIYCGAPLPQSA